MYAAGPDVSTRICGSVNPHVNRTRSASFVLYDSTPGPDVLRKARAAARLRLRRLGSLRGQALEAAIDRDPSCSPDPRTYLAEVEFFFTIQYGFESLQPGQDELEPAPQTHYLAYVRHMPVAKETFDAEDSPAVLGAMLGTDSQPVLGAGVYSEASLFRLTKGVGVGAHEVVTCEDITELAGLIKGSDNDLYVVNKEGCLWLNLGDVEVDVADDSDEE